MDEWINRVNEVDWALGAAVLISGLVALTAGRRGGRFRGLPGWAGFWVVFAGILVSLSYAPRQLSFVMLALLMFFGLRGYFFVAPVRDRDRYAILATYLAIPFALYPAYIGSTSTFLATVPVALFLFVPVFLSFGTPQAGMLDSMGRTLLGVVFYVFCTAHLALLIDVETAGQLGVPASGLPQLFGVLVLASELPQRLAGRRRPGRSWVGPGLAMVVGMLAATGIGFWLGPTCGLVEEDGARAGFLVFAAVTFGSMVSNAVAEDLQVGSQALRRARGAVLDRSVPALYAAPVFFHYLNHFA